MRTILVTGVQGVGKSTVTRFAAQVLGLEDWDYADLMMRVEPTIRCKDDLRFIAWDDRVQVYRKVDNGLTALRRLPTVRSRHCALVLRRLEADLAALPPTHRPVPVRSLQDQLRATRAA